MSTQVEANRGGFSQVAEFTGDTADVAGFSLGGITIFVGTTDPNGAVTAEKGSLFIEIAAPNLHMNTDGAKTWELVGDQS